MTLCCRQDVEIELLTSCSSLLRVVLSLLVLLSHLLLILLFLCLLLPHRRDITVMVEWA